MKKIRIVIAIILALLIIYPIITFSVNLSYSGKKPNDSNYIPEEIFSSISKNSDDTIVKIYNADPTGDLIRGKNISQILDRQEELHNVRYVRAREGNIYSLEYWRFDDDLNLTQYTGANRRAISVVHKYARHYNLLFASSFATAYKNMKVSEVYCFTDAIIFTTDRRYIIPKHI